MLTWENAKIGCRNKFTVGGKLFEPQSEAESKMVSEKAKSIMFKGGWIGVTDKAKEGSYTYDSNGSGIPFSIPWRNISGPYAFDQLGNTITGNDCVGISYTGKWFDWMCSATSSHNSESSSICEANVKMYEISKTNI